MGDVVQLKFFHPRIPRDADTELSISADINMLEKVERWAQTQKNICMRQSKPLPPATRLMLMDAMDALEL